MQLAGYLLVLTSPGFFSVGLDVVGGVGGVSLVGGSFDVLCCKIEGGHSG